MSSTSFPEDVLFNIFTRLSLKEIVRLSCVCKNFRALISQPEFILTHLNLQRNEKFLVHYDNMHSQRCFSVIEDREFDAHSILKRPFTGLASFPRLIGSVNGVIFMSDSFTGYGRNLYLWNPSIWKFKVLPKSCINPYIFHRSETTFALGFGFNRQVNEYKIVRMVNSREVMGHMKAEVFSLGSDAWREVEIEAGIFMDLCSSTVVLNNSIHWIARRRNYNAIVILAFDLNSEKFEEMMLPDYREAGKGYQSEDFEPSIYVDVLQGSLALIACYSEKFGTIGLCVVWVMAEYGVAESWCERCFFFPTRLSSRCLGIMNGRDLILHTHDRKGVVICDFEEENQKYKPLEFAYYIDRLTSLQDSMVLFKEGVYLNPRRQFRVTGRHLLGKKKRSGSESRNAKNAKSN